MKIKQHLQSRELDPERYKVVLDEENDIATFLLWDLTGRLCGFQQYNPSGDKSIRNDERFRDQLKYFTFVGEEGERKKQGKKKLAVWGVEDLADSSYVFITEGIFDAVKLRNEGHAALAVLSNDPHHLSSFLRALGKVVIAVCDRDSAGNKLAKFSHMSIIVPEPFHDLGEMPQHEVKLWLSSLSKLHDLAVIA